MYSGRKTDILALVHDGKYAIPISVHWHTRACSQVEDSAVRIKTSQEIKHREVQSGDGNNMQQTTHGINPENSSFSWKYQMV